MESTIVELYTRSVEDFTKELSTGLPTSITPDPGETYRYNQHVEKRLWLRPEGKPAISPGGGFVDVKINYGHYDEEKMDYVPNEDRTVEVTTSIVIVGPHTSPENVEKIIKTYQQRIPSGYKIGYSFYELSGRPALNITINKVYKIGIIDKLKMFLHLADERKLTKRIYDDLNKLATVIPQLRNDILREAVEMDLSDEKANVQKYEIFNPIYELFESRTEGLPGYNIKVFKAGTSEKMEEIVEKYEKQVEDIDPEYPLTTVATSLLKDVNEMLKGETTDEAKRIIPSPIDLLDFSFLREWDILQKAELTKEQLVDLLRYMKSQGINIVKELEEETNSM